MIGMTLAVGVPRYWTPPSIGQWGAVYWNVTPGQMFEYYIFGGYLKTRQRDVTPSGVGWTLTYGAKAVEMHAQQTFTAVYADSSLLALSTDQGPSS